MHVNGAKKRCDNKHYLRLQAMNAFNNAQHTYITYIDRNADWQCTCAHKAAHNKNDIVIV